MKMLFAAVHESEIGTFATSADMERKAAYGGKAEVVSQIGDVAETSRVQ
jgi:predicted DNA-binding protein with PD1-like motif